VVRARINEDFTRSFRLSHGGEKVDGRLHGTCIFAPGNYQDWALQSLKPLCIDFVKAGPINDHGPAHCFWIVQIRVERLLSTDAESDGRQLPAWPL